VHADGAFEPDGLAVELAVVYEWAASAAGILRACRAGGVGDAGGQRWLIMALDRDRSAAMVDQAFAEEFVGTESVERRFSGFDLRPIVRAAFGMVLSVVL
jgi:hypothetical protein